MDFSTNLKNYRLMTNRTQREMAEFLGISERGYRNYEIGAREPNLSSLIQIADILEVSLDDLVGRSFSKNPLVDSK